MADQENKETWQARLWIANDEGLYEMGREIVRLHSDDAHRTALELKDATETVLYGDDDTDDRVSSGLLGDIVGLWLVRVDWYAVAESLRYE